MSATVLFSNALKLKTELQQDVARLESGQDTSSSLQSKIRTGLASLQRAVTDLDDLGRREVTAVKRETTLGRAAKMRDEYMQIQASYDRFRAMEQAQATLLGTEHVLNQRSHTGYAGSAAQRHPGDLESTILSIDDHMLRERDVLDASASSIDDYLTIGRNALHELYEQRSMLKSTQKRLLDVANALGLSSTSSGSLSSAARLTGGSCGAA
ncbi:hypothetical protein BC831DRAFT_513302 [Entophlyctis helioformis]|nr:hypothetical protein BC831DRAFT_513302 [Entophlyctis helioformis]